MIPLFMSFVALPIFGLGCGYVGTCVWISHGVSFEMMQKLSSYDALVIEGGRLRCAFTAGVLDAFAS
jgi:hypothetical protein